MDLLELIEGSSRYYDKVMAHLVDAGDWTNAQLNWLNLMTTIKSYSNPLLPFHSFYNFRDNLILIAYSLDGESAPQNELLENFKKSCDDLFSQISIARN